MQATCDRVRAQGHGARHAAAGRSPTPSSKRRISTSGSRRAATHDGTFVLAAAAAVCNRRLACECASARDGRGVSAETPSSAVRSGLGRADARRARLSALTQQKGPDRVAARPFESRAQRPSDARMSRRVDRPIGIRCMHRDDVLPIEPEPLQVRDEHLRADDRRIRHRVCGRRHELNMSANATMRALGMYAISMPSACGRPLTLWISTVCVPSVNTRLSPTVSITALLAGAGHRVGRQRALAGQGVLEELLVHFVRHDRDALGDDGADPARVIEVMVRQHAIANRLVRNHAFRFGNDRLRARIVLPGRLEDQDVIGELDGERDIAARDAVDAVRQPLRGRSGRGGRWASGRRTARAGGRRRRRHQRRQIGRIRVRSEDLRVERRPAAALLHDRGRILEAHVVAVVGVLGRHEHVAEHGVLEPRVDARHEVVAIDVADDAIRGAARRLDRRFPRELCHLLAVDCAPACRRVVLLRAHEETPRRYPDLELLRPRRVRARNVLREWGLRRRAARDGHGERYARREQRGLREVDRAPIVVDVDARPRVVRVVALSQVVVRARSVIGDRAQAFDAHVLRSIGDDGCRVLRDSRRRQAKSSHSDGRFPSGSH